MIVQCESANDSTELLDSVRYIIQRETNSYSDTEDTNHINHTVLLLSVARGRQFSGFQGMNYDLLNMQIQVFLGSSTYGVCLIDYLHSETISYFTSCSDLIGSGLFYLS